ncbi:MAG TPA: aldo/keto reductase [Candidatus Levilactobacillus faecigallinarum]|uniref:Aldo/keto reductase n=1 Tax=Candidatus Levilactobacillus faecigallinarum TaxID=2838638 RepID=A0A9D1QR58_9LACO|nr:aldo/keto reductase [Candidatus Levilactobacillus faecigallinarum]
MTALTDTYQLNNGVQIPKIGFGTWQTPARQAKQAVLDALAVGYRHIDTALVYGNEREVGEGVRASGLPREDVFVTSKLPAETKTYQGTLDDFQTTLDNLDLGYLDLYLIHAPQPWAENGADYDRENRDVWRAMEELYRSGKVKAIGVSNFDQHDLKNIADHAEVQPMVDQIQYYVGYTEPGITAYAQDHDILVEAYSPLATGALLQNVQLQAMADKYGVSLAQLAIQFVVQNGVLPLPKATHKDHIESNAQLDFTIDAADMASLNQARDTTSTWHFH